MSNVTEEDIAAMRERLKETEAYQEGVVKRLIKMAKYADGRGAPHSLAHTVTVVDAAIARLIGDGLSDEEVHGCVAARLKKARAAIKAIQSE